MTRLNTVDKVGNPAYVAQINNLPPMGRPAPTTRQRGKVRGARGLYLQERKSLNRWRELRDLKVDQLAELTGTGNSIENYLYKGSVPKADLAERFAAALGVETKQIIWGKVEKKPLSELTPMPPVPPFDPKTRTGGISERHLEIADEWEEAGYTATEITKAMDTSRTAYYNARNRRATSSNPEKGKKGAGKSEGNLKPSGVSREGKKGTK